MKKFMKGCGIAAIAMLAVGFVLAAVAGAVRGRTGIMDVVEAATGGKIHWNPGSFRFPFGNWLGAFGDWFGDAAEELADDLDFVDFDIDDSSIFDKGYDIMKGNVDKYSLGSGFQNLDIDVGGCRLETRYSGDDSFYLEAGKVGKLQGYVKGKTLYIKSVSNVKHWNQFGDSFIILYIPEGYYFDSVDIELGAGAMEIGELDTQEAGLEVGAGQISIGRIQASDLTASIGMGGIEIDDMNVQELDAEIGMGGLEARGQISRLADVECSMGSVEMTLSGGQKDYNYYIESAMGSVELGSLSFSGLGHEQNIDNGADKDIRVECSMGSIVIKFRN